MPGDALAHSSLSPDGTRVAFASIATGNSDVWVQNVDGSDLRPLTNDPASDSWPVWSPDGRWIVYTSFLPGGRETHTVASDTTLRCLRLWKVSRGFPMPSTPSSMADAFRATLDLFETGLELMRQNLRRRHPGVGDEAIELLLHQWLLDRPGAEVGDCPGRLVNAKTRLA